MSSQNLDEPSKTNSEEIAAGLKALAHPVRLRMIQELQSANKPCCGDICECFEYSQSTISQHLSVLVEAGLVECGQDGNKSRYSLNHSAYAHLLESLTNLVPASETGSN